MARSSTAIVTGCDQRFLPFLQDLLLCLRDWRIYDRADVHIFDLDFDSLDRAALGHFPVAIRRIEGEPLAIAAPDPERRHIVSTIRPVIRDFFPGYETYVYLDVDVWLQDPKAIDDFVAAAAGGALAAVAESHPSYGYNLGQRADYLTRIYGAQAVAELAPFPTINGGVFALRADSPVWDLWRDAYVAAVAAGGPWFGSGQMVTTCLSARGEIQFRALPAVYNWMSHQALPEWDRTRKVFVTPGPVQEKIVILHQTYVTKWREAAIRCDDGSTLVTPLTYSAWRRRRLGLRRFLGPMARP